jgi:hypothetical protein
LITSSTKSIQPGTPNICKIKDTDEFEINKTYDYMNEWNKRVTTGQPAVPMKLLQNDNLRLSK